MTKALALKVFSVLVAVLVIAAGLAYFVLKPAPARTPAAFALTGSPSASASPSPSPSPTPSPSEPAPTPSKAVTSKAPAPPQEPVVTVFDVSITCLTPGALPQKIRISAKVKANVEMGQVRMDTNIEPWGDIIHPNAGRDTVTMAVEGEPENDVIWSITVDIRGKKIHKPQPTRRNPCITG